MVCGGARVIKRPMEPEVPTQSIARLSKRKWRSWGWADISLFFPYHGVFSGGSPGGHQGRQKTNDKDDYRHDGEVR